jgi:hypothetical protein
LVTPVVTNRRVYVAINELPESTLRAGTFIFCNFSYVTESRVHYTTLDLFLSKYLEGTNTNINASALATAELTPNKTKDEIGINPFEGRKNSSFFSLFSSVGFIRTWRR